MRVDELQKQLTALGVESIRVKRMGREWYLEVEASAKNTCLSVHSHQQTLELAFGEIIQKMQYILGGFEPIDHLMEYPRR